MYKSIYAQIFSNEDNYVFNSEFVDDYLNVLLKFDKVHEAIVARQSFIKYLKDTNQIDHQIRRAFLEIILLYMVADEKFKLKEITEQFFSSVPNAYKTDEYLLAETL